MLNIHNVTVSIQDLNTVLLIFLQGQKQDIERIYFSLYNHGATDAEYQEMCDTCGYVVIHGNGDGGLAYRKLLQAFTFAAWAEIQNGKKPVKPFPKAYTKQLRRAMSIANERIAAMDRVRWYKPVTELVNIYTIGDSVTAEASTGNWNDDVLGKVLERPCVSNVSKTLDIEEE